MTQKVDEYFGVGLEIDPEIDEREYAELSRKLAERIKDMKHIDPKAVEVYIHKLNMNIKPKYLGLSPLQARLARLDVLVAINAKARESGLIWFLNRELPIRLDPQVEIKAHKYRVAYSLTGEYCNANNGYSDYIAALVRDGCLPKHKELTVTATAYATDRLKQKIGNLQHLGGKVTTKMRFPLTRDVQVTLIF